ncbi:GNAT family N-acetyltransferase [Streptomyces sp. NPDC046203]|uniref:GNAT family N-acetyltransferase n=1 Tax=Streptomyces sp. NPDC046203 TaxID=3154602 RepID=UPI0033D1C9C5
MKIRTGTSNDAERVAALHTESWRTAYAGIMPDGFLRGPLLEDRLKLWRGRLDEPQPGAALFVVESTGEPAGADGADGLDGGEGLSGGDGADAPDGAAGLDGFVYVLPRPDGRLLLDNLHARPGRTGSGIGGRLLRHVFAWAGREHPGRPVYLEVLSANTRAIAFYERHGALRTDERICVFEQGFELPELEYTWPTATFRAQAASGI